MGPAHQGGWLRTARPQVLPDVPPAGRQEHPEADRWSQWGQHRPLARPCSKSFQPPPQKVPRRLWDLDWAAPGGPQGRRGRASRAAAAHSYCQLDTTFSIYVHGAYPHRLVQPEVGVALLVSGILLAVWLAYLTPRHLCAQGGRWLAQCCARWCGMLKCCARARR